MRSRAANRLNPGRRLTVEPLEERLNLSYGVGLIPEPTPGPASSEAGSLTGFGSALYFRASDGFSGRELWSFNGESSWRVADINPGPADAIPRELVVFDGYLYFIADDQTGARLFRYDGSVLSTVPGFAPGLTGSPFDLYASGDALWIATSGSGSFPRLYRLDDQGVAAINQVTESPRLLGQESDGLYYTITRYSNGIGYRSLYRWDGNAITNLGGLASGTSYAGEYLGGLLFKDYNDSYRLLRNGAFTPLFSAQAPQTLTSERFMHGDNLYYLTEYINWPFYKTYYLWRFDGVTATQLVEIGGVGYPYAQPSILGHIGGDLLIAKLSNDDTQLLPFDLASATLRTPYDLVHVRTGADLLSGLGRHYIGGSSDATGYEYWQLGVVPETPPAIIARADGPHEVTVRWLHSISGGEYVLERAEQGGPFEAITTLSATTQLYKDHGDHLEPDTEYAYRVRAADGALFSQYSPVAAARTWPLEPAFNSGPQIVTQYTIDDSPFLGDFVGSIDHLDVTFNEPVDPETFEPADVQIVLPRPIPTSNETPPRSGGRSRTLIPVETITPSSIEQLTATLFRIWFSPQSSPGKYVVRIGPDVTDLQHEPMNQNGDDRNGDGTADRFIGAFHVLTPQLQGMAIHDGGDFPVSIRHWDDPSDNPTTPIRLDVTTWIVMHGRNSSPDKLNIRDVAGALDDVTDGDQVLVVDWKEAADSGIDSFGGEDYIVPVATWVQKALAAYGLQGDQLNLVGHSWGSYVAAELAERTTGGVNSIVGLDPAVDYQLRPVYNPDSTGEVNFAYYSGYSWTFKDITASGAGEFIFGSSVTPPTADEAYLVEGSNHGGVVSVFASLLRDSGSLGEYFDTSRLLQRLPGPMRSDAYHIPLHRPFIYEGIIASDETGMLAVSLRYVDRLSDAEITLQATQAIIFALTRELADYSEDGGALTQYQRPKDASTTAGRSRDLSDRAHEKSYPHDTVSELFAMVGKTKHSHAWLASDKSEAGLDLSIDWNEVDKVCAQVCGSSVRNPRC